MNTYPKVHRISNRMVEVHKSPEVSDVVYFTEDGKVELVVRFYPEKNTSLRLYTRRQSILSALNMGPAAREAVRLARNQEAA